MAAPAVRIRVLGLLRMKQSAAATNQIDDRLVRVPDSLAGIFRQAVAQNSFLIDIAGRVEAVLHAGHEVFGAVRWRGVDDAGSSVHGDVVSEHAKDFAI